MDFFLILTYPTISKTGAKSKDVLPIPVANETLDGDEHCPPDSLELEELPSSSSVCISLTDVAVAVAVEVKVGIAVKVAVGIGVGV